MDLKKCKYVGDVVGRVKNWVSDKFKDFFCSDRMFVVNIGIGKMF